MYTIYGERYKSYEPIVDAKTKEVLDNGEPKTIKLGTWDNKKIADSMAENIKNTVPHRSWKIWVE
jgi:hypothetical protein